MRVEFTCEQCGEPFMAYRCDHRRFCSYPCSVAAAFRPVDERFWAKVNKTDGCWLWAGAVSSNGYGNFAKIGRAGPRVSAHKMSWELTAGPVADGLYVLHRCDVKLCVRPDHLFLGTNSDNMLDCSSKNRHGWRQGGPMHARSIRPQR